MTLVLREAIGDKILKITLNDPDNLNAMGEEMASEFAALVAELGGTPGRTQAIILTGAGRAFSAGGNLAMLEAKTRINPEDNRRIMLDFYNSFLGILKLNIPLIAAINGPAIGAGLCLACACDVRICADTAKLGFTFARLGLHPGMGATYFLPRVIGYAAAAELLLTGRVIGAPEALKIGLASQVTDAAGVVDQAVKIAAEICECGPESVKLLAESLRTSPGSLDLCLEREAICQSYSYAGDEFKEGVKAAMEKRKPAF